MSHRLPGLNSITCLLDRRLCLTREIRYPLAMNALSPIVSEFETTEQAEAHLRLARGKSRRIARRRSARDRA